MPTSTRRTTALELHGNVNGATVATIGHGVVEGRTWRELSLDAVQVPLCWDLALSAPLLLELATLSHAGAAHRGGAPVHLTARQVLHDDQGREVGQAVAVASARSGLDGLQIRSQFLEASFRLEVGEVVRSVEFDGYAPLVAIPGGRAFRSTAWTFESRRGSRYWSLVTTCGEPFDDEPGALARLGASRLERGRLGAAGAWLQLCFTAPGAD